MNLSDFPFGRTLSFKLARRFLFPSLILLFLDPQAQAAYGQRELASPMIGNADHAGAAASIGPRESAADSGHPSLLWNESPTAGFAEITSNRLSSSTPLCSAYTSAPTDAQSLSAGTHTFSVTGSSSGTIWGTGTYTDDSRIATAAVHDGHVAVGGHAVVKLTKSGGLSSYTGSTKNGVTSRSYGSWNGSYTLAFVSACSTSKPTPKPKPTPTPTPSNCSTYATAPSNATNLSNGTHTFVVTGSSSGSVWGTGTYTDDSRIAKAAVHDGHVAVGGKAAIRLTKFGG